MSVDSIRFPKAPPVHPPRLSTLVASIFVMRIMTLFHGGPLSPPKSIPFQARGVSIGGENICAMCILSTSMLTVLLLFWCHSYLTVDFVQNAVMCDKRNCFPGADLCCFLSGPWRCTRVWWAYVGIFFWWIIQYLCIPKDGVQWVCALAVSTCSVTMSKRLNLWPLRIWIVTNQW